MKKEEIYQDLKRQILILKLVPGELLDEVSLSKKYLISRTPMREIFQMLAGEGYLEIIKNKGFDFIPEIFFSHKRCINFIIKVTYVTDNGGIFKGT